MKNWSGWFSGKIPYLSLRLKVALGIILPVGIALLIFTLLDTAQESRIILRSIERNTSQYSGIVMSALNEGLMKNDPEMIKMIITQMGTSGRFQQSMLIGLDGKAVVSYPETLVNTVYNRDSPGCVECHQFSPESRPAYMNITNTGEALASDRLRVAIPIKNEPRCSTCHSETGKHLGVLLADVSLDRLNARITEELLVDAAVTSLAVIIITIAALYMIDRAVTRRIVSLRTELLAYAEGDHLTRVDQKTLIADEITELGNAFNRMADQLNEHEEQQVALNEIRHRAVIEEREYIARELHDGIAQVLSFINTKTATIRLLLDNGKPNQARQSLAQIEEITKGAVQDVREVVIGLRMSSQVGKDLPALLSEYCRQFSRLNEIPIEFSVRPEGRQFIQASEVQLEIFRITQEALHNVRKHAVATQAWVSLEENDGLICLKISDNGVGFNPVHLQHDSQPHYGLTLMKERSEAIGARLEIVTSPGEGTQIIICLPLKPGEGDASIDC